MTTITREQQKQILIDTANHVISRDNTSPYSENLRELARIALASLEAEKGADPVVFTDERNLHHIARGRETSLIWGKQNQEVGDIPLYRHAQPVPVVPEDISGIIERFQYQADHLSEWHHIDEHSCKVNRRDLVTALEFMNSCRAAMLQVAEAVSNRDELPLDYLQGHKDGLEWAAQLAEANHPQTGDWLYDDPIELARAIRKGPDMPTVQAGNSPATTDGWISCSERMPDREYVLAGDFSGTHYLASIPNVQVGIYADWFDDEKPCWDDGDGNDLHLKEVTHWMPLPAPQQEVK
ncbi:DUF551 domain-containing protein [Salmonella enterica]|uniref:DUF551 domain-containing protein n=7 Tax=Salmonella enterica TaxID=28901 RepID=A0A639BNY6_SALET|nr:DUF551 domain-containing protein [Salmonella enterica]MCL9443703.1 DUF551 domain-containing protein [Salmonella enterica subsp. enterica serovar Enteritidis]AKG31189.1 hypothetical protein ZV79_2381 [Salmonella enterica subsp. enterica serovar Typhimurium]EDI0603124.1 DUF551 domain-containing protein [Salmonella enterica subsp. enterica serovar Braenderup]EDI0628604.1 DUF551 domain-containing protein [Salmonella enterica subsp. enterica serovar Mbandaka]EDI0960966.1 DUF551 domain-containing